MRIRWASPVIRSPGSTGTRSTAGTRAISVRCRARLPSIRPGSRSCATASTAPARTSNRRRRACRPPRPTASRSGPRSSAAEGDDEGEPIADGNRDGKVAGFIANPEQQMQRLIRPLNPATASRIGLGPTDLNPPIVDRQMYIVVNQHGEVVGYFGEAVSFIPLATRGSPASTSRRTAPSRTATASTTARHGRGPALPLLPDIAADTELRDQHAEQAGQHELDTRLHH